MRALSRRAWHCDGDRPGGDVGEVADLAVESLDVAGRDQVVVGGVLDQAQLLELGEQVVDRSSPKRSTSSLALEAAVEGGEQAPPVRSGFSIWMSALALGRSR